MNKIPIVLAFDRNCAMQIYITVLSAIANKRKTVFMIFMASFRPTFPDL